MTSSPPDQHKWYVLFILLKFVQRYGSPFCICLRKRKMWRNTDYKINFMSIKICFIGFFAGFSTRLHGMLRYWHVAILLSQLTATQVFRPFFLRRRGFFLILNCFRSVTQVYERNSLRRNSTIPQFHNSAIPQFRNSTIPQFRNSTVFMA